MKSVVPEAFFNKIDLALVEQLFSQSFTIFFNLCFLLFPTKDNNAVYEN